MHLHLNWPGSRSARQRNTESADWPRLRKTLCPAIGFLFSFSVFRVFFPFFFCRFSHFSARKTSWRPDFFLPSNAKPSLTCSSAFDSCLVCSLLIISLIKFMVHKPEISIQMHRGQGVRRKAKDFK